MNIKTKPAGWQSRRDFCAAATFVDLNPRSIAVDERGYKMKQLKFTLVISCLVFLALSIAPRVKAQTTNEKTVITFSEPFEVPGVDAQILPPGTYLFTLVDSLDNRNIVRITSEDGLHVFTTILAINNYRLKPTDKTVLTFKERGEGQPQAIKAWFYPGYAFGQEFVYPKKRAMELAQAVNEPVLAMPVEPSAAEPVETLKSVPVAAVKPTGEDMPVAEVVENPPTRAVVTQPQPASVVAQPQPVAVVAQAEPRTLPKTASSLPIFASIGLLSLIAGFSLLIITKRSA